MMVAPVIVQFNLTNELQANALMLYFGAGLLQLYIYGAPNIFAVVIDKLFDFLALFDDLNSFACVGSVKLELDITARTKSK